VNLVLDVVAAACIGPLVGTEFAVSVFINPVLWRLDEGAQLEPIGLFARRLGTAMPFWYVACFLLLVGETIMHLHRAGAMWIATAVGLWAIVIVGTLMFLVPINNRLARNQLARKEAAGERAGGGPSARSEIEIQAAIRDHHRWDGLHRVRIAMLTIAMIFFLIGILG
jgi:uncharacterized membrane protein